MPKRGSDIEEPQPLGAAELSVANTKMGKYHLQITNLSNKIHNFLSFCFVFKTVLTVFENDDESTSRYKNQVKSHSTLNKFDFTSLKFLLLITFFSLKQPSQKEDRAPAVILAP